MTDTNEAGSRPISTLHKFDGTKEHFFSYGELQRYAEDELEAWRPLAGPLESVLADGWATPARNMFRTLEAVRKLSAQLANDDIAREPIAESLTKQLAAFRIGYVPSGTPTAQGLIHLAMTSPASAAILLNEIVGDRVSIKVTANGDSVGFSFPSFVRDMVQYELSRASLPDSAIYTAAFEKNHAHQTRIIDEEKRVSAQALLDAENATIALAEAQKIWRAKTDEALRSASDAVEKWKFDAAEEVAAARRVFLEDIKIHSAVTYWRKIDAAKTIEMNTAFWWFAAVAIVAGAGAMCLGAALAWTPLPNLKEIGLVGTALVSLPIVMVLWILKHLARAHVEAKRTATDAAHRATLVETYLALLKEDGKVIEEKDRLLVLAAIFSHPGATSEADTMPATVIDVLLKSK